MTAELDPGKDTTIEAVRSLFLCLLQYLKLTCEKSDQWACKGHPVIEQKNPVQENWKIKFI